MPSLLRRTDAEAVNRATVENQPSARAPGFDATWLGPALLHGAPGVSRQQAPIRTRSSAQIDALIAHNSTVLSTRECRGRSVLEHSEVQRIQTTKQYIQFARAAVSSRRTPWSESGRYATPWFQFG